MSRGEENWEDLEVFTSLGARISKQYVRITKNSIFLFNSGFVHQAQLKSRKLTHVIFAYSPKKKAIVFDFTNDPQAKGAHKVILRLNSASSGSRSFFNYHSLDPKQLEGKYTPKLEKIPKIGEVWVIYLNAKIND